MAGSAYTAESVQAQTYRRSGLLLQAELRANALTLCGDDPDAIIHVEPSTGTKRGTTEVITFQTTTPAPMPRGRLSQTWGSEPTESHLNDSLTMAYLALGIGGIENEIADQGEIEFSMRGSVHTRMAQDAARIMECSLLHQLAGYSPVNDLTSGGPDGHGYKDGTTSYILSCGNACVEPDALHHDFADDNNGINASEADVANNSTSFLSDRGVRRLLRKMLTDRLGNKYPWSPPQTPWGKGYVVLCTGEGMDQLKARLSDNDIWDLARACIEGGMDPENSTLWTHEGFKYRDVFYLQNDHLPMGTQGSSPGSSTVGEPLPHCQRALLLAPRAGHIRWGEGFSRNKWCGFVEQTFVRRYSCLMDTVMGMNVTIPNAGSRTEAGAQRWGCAVLSHYTDATVARYD